MAKINVFVFAAHHLAGNIAAQRFKGLLKYLDPAKYRIFVFAREPAAGVSASASTATSTADITVFPLPGHCVGSESSTAASLLTMASAFLRPLPFLLSGSAERGQPWLVNALAAADRLCVEKRDAGERCVAIGTYSPIDSLVAAASLASRHRIGCLQDFRDGLVFEPLGKPGSLRTWVRSLVEGRVVAAADLITSVSPPLVADFQRRYPGKAAAILPNGYDPADFVAADKPIDDDTRVAAMLARHVPAGARLIGHFGRIGASDGSASKSLDFFVDALNESPAVVAGNHVMFVGELTAAERATLERARFSVSAPGAVERTLALQLMQRCDKLLLLTGSRASCATGKLFEYLAAGADIVCVSGVRNAATAILAETGAGCSVLTSAGASAGEALRSALSPRPADTHRDISPYSKQSQAGMLDRWISDMVHS
ncbi:glycosyl transferase [Rhodanobacter hydrolyticus]|uniref:Glycosyl transferase n=2 Tax=Rhodanobacter hydrolyticus TaxID=2250595 RepID=A0ABW8JCD6_9GAMM